MGIGAPEVLTILAVVLVISALSVPSILQRRYPYRLGLGLTLCAAFGAMGQMYLPKSIRYVLLLGLIYVILNRLGYSYAFPFAHLLSIPLIYWRFKRLSPTETDPFVNSGKGP